MPWGLTRFQQSGQSHFVTFCCYHRRRLFTTEVSCRIFDSALGRVRHTFGLQVYGYVVMPEHVHLLLSEPQRDTLADGLKSLTQGVSRRLINCDPLKPKVGLSGPSNKSPFNQIPRFKRSECVTDSVATVLLLRLFNVIDYEDTKALGLRSKLQTELLF
jgi:REP element-mobilizing transposase RayT